MLSHVPAKQYFTLKVLVCFACVKLDILFWQPNHEYAINNKRRYIHKNKNSRELIELLVPEAHLGT